MKGHLRLSNIFFALVAVCGIFAVNNVVFAQLNCVSLTSTTTYTEEFNNGGPTNIAVPPATTGTTLPPGFNFLETGGDAIYGVGIGSSTAGNTYSFGAAAMSSGNEQERSFGSLASGTVNPIYFGFCFTNNTGFSLNSIAVQYVGEQWRSANTSAQSLTVDYRTNVTPAADTLTTGAFIAVPALNFVSPNLSNAGAIDGNAIPNTQVLTTTIPFGTEVANGQSFVVRWTDINDTGNDHALAIDSLRFTPNVTTAAGAVVGGRITDSRGRGLSRVVVMMTGSGIEETIYATTTAFGYYRFEDVPAGNTYILTASSIRYTFEQPNIVINVNGDLGGADFVGQRRISGLTDVRKEAKPK